MMVESWTLIENAIWDADADAADGDARFDENYELWKVHMIFAEKEFRFGQKDMSTTDLEAASNVGWRIQDRSKREYAILATAARQAYYSRRMEKASRLYFKCLLLWTSNSWDADQVVSGLLAEMAAIEFLFSNFESAENLLVVAVQLDESTVGKEHDVYKEKELDLFWFRSAVCTIRQNIAPVPEVHRVQSENSTQDFQMNQAQLAPVTG